MFRKILIAFILITSVSRAQTRIYEGFQAGRGLVVINDNAYTMISSELRSVSTTATNPTEQIVSSGFYRSGTIPFTGTNIERAGGNSIIIPGGSDRFAYASTNGLVSLEDVNFTTESFFAGFRYNGSAYFISGSTSNSKIRRYVSSSNSVVVANLSSAATDILDVAIDGDNLYYTAVSEGRIYKVDLSQTNPTAQSIRSGLSNPWGITYANGFLYFVEAGSNARIRKIDTNGGSLQNVGNIIPGGASIDIVGQDIFVLSPSTVSNGGGLYKYTDTSLPGPCEAPTAISEDNPTLSTTTINWNTVNFANNYDLIYTISGQPMNSGTTISGISGNSVVLNSLTIGESYDVYIRTNCTSSATTSQSGYSNVFTFTHTPDSCLAPTNIFVNNLTLNTATVNWDAANHAINYDLVYVLSGQPINAGTTISGITGTSATINNLTIGESYDVYIRTNCTNVTLTSQSGYSNAFTFTQQDKIYVDVNATGNNDGSSWQNAFTDLQTALQGLSAHSFREIWVARGTYKPSATHRSVSYTFSEDNTNIYGGFAGNEIQLSDRDMSLIHTTNATILSGDIQGNDDNNVTFNNSTRNENTYTVVKITANNVLIDGVTVSGGYCNATAGENRFGAGIKCDDSTQDFTLQNSVIKDNVAWWAAGVHNANNNAAVASNVVFDSCIFDNNLSWAGSSTFYILPLPSATINFTLTNSLIINNRSEDDGANQGRGGAAGLMRAYFTNSNISVTLVNNTFVGNVSNGTFSGSDQSILTINEQDGTVTSAELHNNIFWGNVSPSGGAGLSIGKQADTTLPSLINVSNSIAQDGFSNITNKTNILNTDPLFTDTANGDFTLQLGSPAIDSGGNSLIPAGIDKDILGNARIFNATVDMGAFEYGSMPLSINDNDILKSFSLYPNPTKGMITIDSEETIHKIEIYNYLGKRVLISHFNSINAQNLAKGVYILKIYTSTNKIGVKRFIKH